GMPPHRSRDLLDAALATWRGPPYADFDEMDWARSERVRLEQLRLVAVERRAGTLLALGPGGLTLSPTRRARHRASVARGGCGFSGSRSTSAAGRARPRCAARRAGTARGRARNRPVSGAATTGNDVLQQSPNWIATETAPHGAGLHRRGHSLRAGRRRRLARPTRVRGEPAAQPRGDRRRRTDRGPRATTRNDHRSGVNSAIPCSPPGDRELRRTGRLGTFRRSRAGCTRRRRRPPRAGRPSRRQRQRAVPAAGGRRDGVAWHPRPGRHGCLPRNPSVWPEPSTIRPAGTCPERSLHAVVPPLRPCPERESIGREILGLARRHALVNFEVLGHLIRMQAPVCWDTLTRGPARPTRWKRSARCTSVRW
ncbi:hypothetical protein GS528_28270, partial [Rhodococcus hoagii]|nr:hypothetical protein [Prescottella equi]